LPEHVCARTSLLPGVASMSVLSNDQFYNALAAIKLSISSITAGTAGQQAHLAQRSLTDVQETYQSLVDAKHALEAEVVHLRAWNIEKAAYTPYKLPSGVLVHTKTPKAGSRAPTEWLCPKCFHKEQKSFLVPGENQTHITARCPECGEVYPVQPIDRLNTSLRR
jgi:transcription elongation factor Elf1